MKAREFRQLSVEYRVDGSRPGAIVADVMTYNKLDDYGTEFDPAVFTESLEKRMPRICWGHDWLDPIGQWTDAENNKKSLRLAGQLDLGMIQNTSTPAVPSAHRAYAQLESGTIDQFSVGFVRQVDEKGKIPGSYRILKALLDEVSPVLVGAVPGTKLVSIRSTRTAPRLTRAGLPAGTALYVPSEYVQDLIVRFERGEIDLGDTIAELKKASLTFDELPTETPEEEEEEETEDPEEEIPEEEEDEVPELPEDLDAALEAMGITVS